ncbi:hypothetical protein [Thiolapillus sp.]|nr:hypothetical protein [Thiolapillus sp.]
MQQDPVIYQGKSLKTVPVAVRENVCGTEAAAKSAWMYLRRF